MYSCIKKTTEPNLNALPGLLENILRYLEVESLLLSITVSSHLQCYSPTLPSQFAASKILPTEHTYVILYIDKQQRKFKNRLFFFSLLLFFLYKLLTRIEPTWSAFMMTFASISTPLVFIILI